MPDQKQKQNLGIYAIACCAIFIALIAAGAFIQIPLPLVPITLQTFFVILSGLLLGPKLGAMACGTYLLLGLMGVPIFTQGGGIFYIFKPTFGYLIGFIIGSALAGYLAQKYGYQSVFKLFLAGAAGMLAVYLFGSAYFYFLANYYLGSPTSVGALLMACVVPFVPADLIFCFFAAVCTQKLRKALGIKKFV